MIELSLHGPLLLWQPAMALPFLGAALHGSGVSGWCASKIVGLHFLTRNHLTL